MPNAIYDPYKTAAMIQGANSSLNQNTDVDGVYSVLIDTEQYIFDPLHVYFSPSILGVIGSEMRLMNNTVAAIAHAVFDADDVTHIAVAPGPTIEAVVLFRRNAVGPTTWRLVAYMDTAISGLPIQPNGGDITLIWAGAGIFKM
jgi:hypothetical protein